MQEYDLSYIERDKFVDYLGILSPTSYGLENAWADGYVSVVEYYWNGHYHTQSEPMEIKGWYEDDFFYFRYNGKEYCLENDFELC